MDDTTEQTEAEHAITCPGCVATMTAAADPDEPNVTHYTCACGWGLGIKRDALGILAAWREDDESRN